MVALPKPRATYADLDALPEDQKAELMDGVLYMMTTPKLRHQRLALAIGTAVSSRFDRRPTDEHPGGWWIAPEAEVHLRYERRVVRPDLVGWRREHMPNPPWDTHKMTTIPDWVCEALSPSTTSYDYLKKMPAYLEAGVPWVWLVDPVRQTIDVFENIDGRWSDALVFERPTRARIPPFDAVELDLEEAWPERGT